MPHTLNPSVPVTLDKERSLLYGSAAFIEFKEATGKDLLKAFAEMGQHLQAGEIPVKEFRDILWAGLIHEDESLTPKDVTGMFTPRSMVRELVTSVNQALSLALGDVDEDEPPQKAPARQRKSTGANSGALHVATSASPGLSSAS